ncbi:ATP-binding cassette domain-containing protein [soil metagenome]
MILTMRSRGVEMKNVTYRYPDAVDNALNGENWSIERGSFALVVGPSGSGKSSLLRCLNGLAPHFSGGAFGGSVLVDGRDTRSVGPRDLSQSVGFVFQDPESQLVTDRVDDEIAFGLEQHGIDRLTIAKRVEESLDNLGVEKLRNRRPSELSGGERQRVAIAAALAMHPQLLVLDEPTSQLDPWGAEDVVTVLARMNEDLGLTIVVAEHRLDRLLGSADVVRAMGHGPESAFTGPPREAALRLDPVALPPVTRLGRALGVSHPPLTVTEARVVFRDLLTGDEPAESPVDWPGALVASMTGVKVELGGETILNELSFDAREGELVALMGRNGSGKTTLLRTIAGLQRVEKGNVTTCGVEMTTSSAADLHGAVGYVPQQASTLFFKERLIDELVFTARARGTSGDIEDILLQFELERSATSHPLDLSGGERERAALATVMVGRPRLLLLDEPTRGMDAWRKTELAEHLQMLRRQGVAIVIVTHDVELVAHCATRVVMLGNSCAVSDGHPRAVLTDSSTYSTQINRVFGGRWLTVEDVVSRIGHVST